jgi:hypothetical protein
MHKPLWHDKRFSGVFHSARSRVEDASAVLSCEALPAPESSVMSHPVCATAPARVRRIFAGLALVLGASLHAETLTLEAGDTPAPAPAASTASKAPAPYVGYTGASWNVDFGVMRGRCDRAAVGAALGDPKAALPGQPPVALLSGVDADGTDRACAAHAIELVRNGRTVRWKGSAGSVTITPLRDAVSGTMPCREVSIHGLGKLRRATACSAELGVWQFVSR